MKCDVFFDCLNGRHARLMLCGDSYENIVQKAKDILVDNQGGTAEICDGIFSAIVEA